MMILPENHWVQELVFHGHHYCCHHHLIPLTHDFCLFLYNVFNFKTNKNSLQYIESVSNNLIGHHLMISQYSTNHSACRKSADQLTDKLGTTAEN